MKKIILLMTVCLGVTVTGGLMAQNQPGSGKTLVVFFSWSGNARTLAGQIAQVTGSDLFEIKPATPYPNDYDECTKIARREQDTNARPAVAEKVANMTQYGTIFLCYPIWYRTMPMVVFTFLESYDFSGKKIYPLVTHGSSRFGRSLDDIQKLCPKAVIGEGLAVSVYDRDPTDAPKVTVPNSEVTTWLRRLGAVR